MHMVHIRAEGSLAGFEAIEENQEASAAGEAGMVLVAHLLELLVTFIGAPLTLHLVRDKWPDATLD